MTTAYIRKWGNSFGVRIPQLFLHELNIEPDEQVEIHIEAGKIILQPIREKRYDLDELIDQISPANIHGEEDYGTVGRELI